MRVRVKEGNGPIHEIGLSGAVISGDIQWIEVPEFYRARVYRGPSLGVGDYTGIFHAGRYNDAWLYSKWLQRGGPKYIRVDATAFRESELLECRWWEKARDGRWRTGIQKFEPGDFEVRPPSRDFLNDVFGEVRMPEDATATLWEALRKVGAVRHLR